MPAGSTKRTRSAGNGQRASRSNGSAAAKRAAWGTMTNRARTSGSTAPTRSPMEASKAVTIAAPSSTRRTVGACSGSSSSWLASVPVSVTTSGTSSRRASRSASGPERYAWKAWTRAGRQASTSAATSASATDERSHTATSSPRSRRPATIRSVVMALPRTEGKAKGVRAATRGTRPAYRERPARPSGLCVPLRVTRANPRRGAGHLSIMVGDG